jgi:phage shock protein C
MSATERPASQAERRGSRRLTRSRTDRKIAGVCGGFAAYSSVDANIVRLVMVLLAVMGGSGIVLYLVAWAIVRKRTWGRPQTTAGIDQLLLEAPHERRGHSAGHLLSTQYQWDQANHAFFGVHLNTDMRASSGSDRRDRSSAERTPLCFKSQMWGLFPAAGIIGSRAGASRTPCGRRCAAGPRPVLDPAARSHGMAAARGREQERLDPRGS